MKVFIGLLAVFVVLSCGSTKDPIIKIKTGQKANKAKAGSQLQLSVNSSLENFKVKFFLNDQPISSNHQFSDTDPLGEYKIKAVLTQKDKSFERTTIFTLLASKAPKLFTYEVINIYPHDITAYTQGLEFDGDLLYESTGLNGKSSLRKVDYRNGEILKNKPLDKSFFGEGLTILENRIIQLTWKSQKGFVYDKTSLNIEKSFPYQESKEGWGLCNDGNKLYKSDGSERIWQINSNNFIEENSIQVMTNKLAIKNLNELEWVNGKIFANTYQFQKDVVVIKGKNESAPTA